MPSLNKNKSNHINTPVIENTIERIACGLNNLLIINNIGYFKELFLMIDF